MAEVAGSLMSFGRDFAVARVDSPAANVRPGRIVFVDSRNGPVTLTLQQFRDGDRVVIVDEYKNFNVNPVLLQGGNFHQSGANTYRLDQVGASSEWWLRYQSGTFYTEVAPVDNLASNFFATGITTTPGTPIIIPHNLGDVNFVATALNTTTGKYDQISIVPVDANSAAVDSNSAESYYVSFFKLSA